MIRVRQPAYVDENLFFEYISQVLVLYVSNLREKPEFANETAVLLMDSTSLHVSKRVLQLLDRSTIMAIAFPAHTTNISQTLDLVFFGVLKKIKQTETGEFDERSVREQITKLPQAYEQTTTSMTIRASFQKAGLWPDSGTKPFKLQFNEESLREKPGFKGLWGAKHFG